ncbi:hypothetical protein L7F22_004025 [Adiantum nelumboides]|nr:hypothetical protein [Adiantum nelumboides]
MSQILSGLHLTKTMLTQTENESLVFEISLTVALLLACMLFGHLLHTNKWVNESITSLLLGLCAGLVVFTVSKGQNSHILTFDENLFFYYLLPPIIFNAGFQVKKKQFFQNFAAIMLFGVIGVFISFTIITFVVMILTLYLVTSPALGVIFSATDSVCTLQVLHQDETPLLYSLVFGEGVMNDASSVVLFNAIQSLNLSKMNALQVFVLVGKFFYLFFTSTFLGLSVGLLSAYLIKKLYVGSRHSTDRETAIMVLMPYLGYMLAEFLQLSGILTVFFCGIVMSHYTWHNVTQSSRITTRHMFATLSFIAETFIFLYVGMDALDKEKWKKTNASPTISIALSATLLTSVIIGRATFVFPLSTFSNILRSSSGTRISFRHQVIIWWAGLMRGAVSIALAYNQFTLSGVTRTPVHATVITSTVIVVLFSTMVFGMLTKPLVEWMLPHHMRSGSSSSDSNSLHEHEDIDRQFFGDSLPNGNVFFTKPSSLHMLLRAPTSTVHYFWRKFDDTYMRPMFGGRHVTDSTNVARRNNLNSHERPANDSPGLVPDILGSGDANARSALYRAWGQVRDYQSLVFFDPGTKINFINPQLAEKMGIKMDEMWLAYIASMAAPGHEVAVTHLIRKLRLHIQGFVDHKEFCIMPLEECDVLLDKGKQVVCAIRVSKVVSALMLNANTNVSVPINLSNQVLSLLGFVGKHPLNVLVDSGCSTNFVSTMLVSKLRLPTQQSVETFQVELADGSYMQCNKKVQQLEFQIQDYQDQLGFSVMSLSHYDMILGQSWLYQYDPITSFRDHSIRLFHQNQEVELRGLFNTQPITLVSAMQVKRLVRKRDLCFVKQK